MSELETSTGRIFLVVGSPAVGKTSTTESLAERFDKAIQIPVDDLRSMVVTGYVWPDAEWSPEVDRQVRLARQAARQMAESYADAGFTVVIDDFWDPHAFSVYDCLRERPGTVSVLLLPSEEETQRRNAERGGEGEAYVRWAIGHVYGLLAPHLQSLPSDGWLVLDSTHLDLQATVNAILRHGQD